jgi:DNA-binding transcriptional LysR family regulator
MIYILTMPEVNLNGVDLNLLPPLEALLRLRHVTQAAGDVGLSQPAMSRALARLRALLEDPLLVKGRSAFVLTPRALALAPVVAAALSQTKTIFQPADFDPATAARSIRMATTDTYTVLLSPQIVARLSREAPSITLEMAPITRQLQQQLEDGAVDFALALAKTPLPARARSMPLASDRLVVVMSRTHPMARRPWTMADYGRFKHATVTIFGDGRSEMDSLLAEAGISRTIGFTSPHFTAALSAVAASQMVTTISEAFARSLAKHFDLVIRPAPFAASELPVILVWSHVRDHDPLHLWFRRIVKDTCVAVFESPFARP